MNYECSKHVAKRVIWRASLLTFLIVLLTSDIFIRRTSAQATCQSLQVQMRDLISQKQDAQSALYDSTSCSGTRHAECVKRVANLTNQIAKVQKLLDTQQCPPDPQTTPATMAICCGWRVERHPRVALDIDTNGKADIVAFGDDGVLTALSTGTGGFAAPIFALGNLGYNQGWRVDKHVRLLADVDGDKRPDLVGFGDAGVWLALASPSGGFKPAALVVQGFGVNQGWDPSKHVRAMADINGDGKADIVAFGWRLDRAFEWDRRFHRARINAGRFWVQPRLARR